MTQSTILNTDPASRASRYTWVDLAKGFCIIAVVAQWVNREVGAGQAGWISYFVAFAKPFRMPDFFLISGLFLSRVLDRPWLHYLDTKVVHYLYFLVLWTLIIIPGMWILQDNWPASPQAVLQALGYGLLRPVAMLWFLLVLSMCFITTRWVRNVPKAAVTLVGAALMLGYQHIHIPTIESLCRYFIFFYCGYAYSERIFTLADWARDHPRVSWTLIALWAVFNAYVIHATGGNDLPVLLALGFLGICALVMAASLLCHLPGLNGLTQLGKNSIAVYLGFYLILNIFLWAAEFFPELNSRKAMLASLAWAVSILGSAAIFHATRHTPLRYLYARPAWAKITHWTALPPTSRAASKPCSEQ